MARGSARQIFLETRSYRRRRVVDGLRLLPIIGAWLFLVPILWPEGAEAPPMSAVLLYIFSVWLGLTVLAGLLIALQRHLGPDPEPEPPASDPVAGNTEAGDGLT